MSKSYRSLLAFAAAAFALFTLVGAANSQDLVASIKVDPPSGTVHVTGRFMQPTHGGNRANLSFLLDYAGVSGLGKRFSSVVLADTDGKTVANKRMIDGEYLGERGFINWKYTVDLTPPSHPAAAAHVSWLTRSDGLLMLHDLLPVTLRGQTAEISFDLPAGWTISSADRETSVKTFTVADAENAVFFLSAPSHAREVAAAGSGLRLNISGSWPFSDAEAAEIAAGIYNYFEKLFKSRPKGDVLIGLRRFPQDVRPGNWEADTRGTTINIISSDMPFKSQSLQRLHEQLRHEIFHLWIPNGLNLIGNYDWFYEGFALYQSLKMAVAVNRIRFDDMLDTLSRVYAIDNRKTDRISLIDASKRRWNNANTDVYARGMLVAFLCDLTILERTKGKRSVSDLLTDVYVRHKTVSELMDGDAAILTTMDTYEGLGPVVSRYIKGSERIDLAPTLKAAGLEIVGGTSSPTIKVVSKPSGRQKDFLDQLGYNNWRKLSRKQ